MKKQIGGDRLGAGGKETVSMRNYERSTHDLSYIWRSSMAAGTLVPFMSNVALPGDKFDIDLNCEVRTLPTIGPLFGSYKVQLDVFKIPIRLYNAKLHMNMLGIGMDMSKIKLPLLKVPVIGNIERGQQDFRDNAQINSSCILKYLGISGIGTIVYESEETYSYREFNAIPLLAYWDIFKNYYANKQEENAYVIHTTAATIRDSLTPINAILYKRQAGQNAANVIYNNEFTTSGVGSTLVIVFPNDAYEPNIETIRINIDGNGGEEPLTYWANGVWSPIGENNGEGRQWQNSNVVIFSNWTEDPTAVTFRYDIEPAEAENAQEVPVNLEAFPLEEIDEMKLTLLSDAMSESAFDVFGTGLAPYKFLNDNWEIGGVPQLSILKSQEGLAVKTYQSDLFNNWIETEWIDGDNGINALTAIDTTGDSFTIDAFNLASKVYVMLNRIAISGGSYDDWLDAVYTHDRTKSEENPVYMGGLIKELAFEEVVSQTETNNQPLGTLAGKGKMTSKNKGGKITISVDEPSYIMGIASLTPRVDYSQGNRWDVNLKTMDDLHKPALDGIGFQDLITDQMHWADTRFHAGYKSVEFNSAGKQPAWINYMTDYNRTYGNFAEEGKEMFMTLNRRYEVEEAIMEGSEGDENGRIIDLTTYIDPSKYNTIFAEQRLDAQNFWMQIKVENTARRKMSAKIIPNL